MSDLIRRQIATQATMDKYRAKQWSWEDGVTCVHLARFHLLKMGHKPPMLPRIRSLIAAKRALAARGWKDTADMLGAYLPQIAPARMLIGDLAVAPSDDGLGGVLICAGPHKLLGWHEDAPGMVVIDYDMDALVGAYHV